MSQVSKRGHISSHLNLESFLTPAPTQMGSSQTNPPHPPIQHHTSQNLRPTTSTWLRENNLLSLKYNFALMITMVYT